MQYLADRAGTGRRLNVSVEVHGFTADENLIVRLLLSEIKVPEGLMVLPNALDRISGRKGPKEGIVRLESTNVGVTTIGS